MELQQRWERARDALAAAARQPAPIPGDVALELLETAEIYVDALHLLLEEDAA
jgi:hypothetical protein